MATAPKKTRVAINGFGRIGRLALRSLFATWKEAEIVLINEIKGGVEAGALLLEYDSVHGRWPHTVTHDSSSSNTLPGTTHAVHTLTIDGTHHIAFTAVTDPALIPWRSLGIDVVMECTGKYVKPLLLQAAYFDSNNSERPRKVVVSAPVKQDDSSSSSSSSSSSPLTAINIVMAVNDHLYDPHTHHLITAASCTTNCLAPAVAVVLQHAIILRSSFTTIHNVTGTQVVVDSAHSDLRRARSCLQSLVPTTTGSASAIALIFPQLKNKIHGIAVRVPLLNASITDVVFELQQPTTAAVVNSWFTAAAAEGRLKNILGVESKPLVSCDYKSDSRSVIVDTHFTTVIDGTQLKLLLWYDNEYGYACRMAELTYIVATTLPSQ